jgi:N-acyl-L-homoserine lactone synthetase
MDDSRSIQFAVIERKAAPDASKVVGVSRLIQKRETSGDDRLPVEILFPDFFEEQPLEAGVVEGSRLIARHPNRHLQRLIDLANIRAMDLWARGNSIEYIYGIAEEPFLRHLRMLGLPYEQLSDFQPLAEFGNTSNAPIRFNTEQVCEAAVNNPNITAFRQFFAAALDSNGLGYFDITLHHKVD